MSDNDMNNVEKKSETFFPVFSLEERKRRIKERLSKQQRANSLPIEFSSRSFHENKRIRTNTSISNFPKFDSSNVVRQDSFSRGKSVSSSISKKLFIVNSDSEATELPDSSTFLEKFEVDQNDDKIPPRIGKSGSLFDQVRQHTSTVDDHLSSSFKKPMNRQPESPAGKYKIQHILDSLTSPFRAEKTEKTSEKKPPPFESKDANNKWKEVPIGHIVDWKIKNSLSLECHPGSCLPDSTTFVLEDWNNALRFWQFPAKLPKLEKTTTSTKKIYKSKHKVTQHDEGSVEQPSTIAQKLVDAVRGPKAYVHKLIQSDEGLVNFRLLREWQDAFSSLYNMWMDKIEEGNEHAYFYVIAHEENQVILFRPTKVTTLGILTPVILFSSSSIEFRTKLISRGLTLYFPQGETFREPSLNVSSDEIKKSEDSSVEADLEALRKAQVFGENPGVHVNVKKMRTKRVSRGNVDIPLLYISGYDDCASFFTVFLNRDIDTKHPILLSRLGPFQNATQKSLIQFRRQVVQEDIGHIELRGPILPCATIALLQATAICMQQKKKDEANLEDAILQKEDTELGSYYFVIQTKNIIQNTTTYTWNGQFNLSVSMNNCLADDKDPISDISGRQKGADLFVWDISRPNVKAFKLTNNEN